MPASKLYSHNTPLIVRFWKSIEREPDNGCWNWIGSHINLGYGKISNNGKRVLAHRLAYEWVHGEIPKGLVIDHLCRNPKCVNPTHLEAVTQKENILRGVGTGAKNAQSTHCPRGHEYNATFVWNGQTARYCRQCKRDQMKAHHERKRANV